ncbi:MAG: EamA family transporter [Alphaproteobacteria bacterium]|nr:EamA family transporter [Alphaproteobacteria bacterium]
MTPITARKTGILFLVGLWFCWGFSYPATKIILRELDIWTSRTLIMGAAGILLLILAFITKKTLKVPKKYYSDLIIAAFLNMTIFQICMTLGVHFFSAGRTVVIVYTMPLWAILFAWLLLDESPPLSRLIALIMGVSGLAVLLSQDFSHLYSPGLGALCTIIGAISFGLGTVWMKRRVWENDPTVIAGWQLIIGTIPLIPFWMLMGTETPWTDLRLVTWGNFIFLIIIANVLAYFLWFRILQIFPASVSGLGTLAVPIVGIIASALILGEIIGPHELIALGLIVSALALNLKHPDLK